MRSGSDLLLCVIFWSLQGILSEFKCICDIYFRSYKNLSILKQVRVGYMSVYTAKKRIIDKLCNQFMGGSRGWNYAEKGKRSRHKKHYPFYWKLLKVGSVSVRYIIKNVPFVQVHRWARPCPSYTAFN